MDFLLPNGLVTNSLCVHYLAYHRDEVPPSELAKIDTINENEELDGMMELEELRTFLNYGKLVALGDEYVISHRQTLTNQGLVVNELKSNHIKITDGTPSNTNYYGVHLRDCPRYENEIENICKEAVKEIDMEEEDIVPIRIT